MRAQLTLPLVLAVLSLSAQNPPGEGPALGQNRIQQSDIASQTLTLDEIRSAGLKVFSTPFNKLDGLGDGPMDPFDPGSPGGRPSLQNNGTFLRVNGLDSQSCLECHSVGSSAVIPFTMAVGGAGASSANVMAGTAQIDVRDTQGNNYAFFDGRFINPPFVFGSGGVELAAQEMTRELQALLASAIQQPGTTIALQAKGLDFGSIVYDTSTGLDTSAVVGVASDLVVRPFGRKGEFATVRAFAKGAMAFHFGMQPEEDVGTGVDSDGDGVADEILIGELSAVHIFGTNLERPVSSGNINRHRGFHVFNSIGCAECHTPVLDTLKTELGYRYPEVEPDPDANEYYRTDLASSKAGFAQNGSGGLTVELFSDLKRHDMGPSLAESHGTALDPMFVTARLWGVADTAPYLHDGRATTLTEAIEQHDGEGLASAQSFSGLPDLQKMRLLAFLRTLRTPRTPAADIQ